MSDPGGCTLRQPPTAAEVVGRLKDDGDFDALRRAIVRKVKDNDGGKKTFEHKRVSVPFSFMLFYSAFGRRKFQLSRVSLYQMCVEVLQRWALLTWPASCSVDVDCEQCMEVLRNKIISEVKQSVVLQEDGSERMKLKDLSDAIFQDIGSKIMGQLSDEVWNVIRSNETDIQGTVNAVYNRILNPEEVPEPSSKKLKRKGKEEQVLPTKTATTVAVEVEDDDPEEPPGFGFSNTQRNDIGATKPPMNLENGNEAKPNGGEPAAISNPGDEEDPEVPPGFG